jgi:hypothetical protein
MWARSQYRLVILAAEFADSVEWLMDGSPSAAHWLAEVADVETCTAREWIRVGRKLAGLPAIAAAFAEGRLSYAKVRALTRLADSGNETELLHLAEEHPASCLAQALATWLCRSSDPDELADYQRRQRSVKWRTEPDGMVTFIMRLEPLVAGMLSSALTAIVMRGGRPAATQGGRDASAERSTLAQQRADAVEILLTEGSGDAETEVIIHVRGDGSTLDDGSPIPDTVVERIAPSAFLRALIHDAESRPVNASTRRRHPSTRQKRIVKERDRTCVDCGRADLLEYDHSPPYHKTGRTTTDELELRCAPCHRRRHGHG